MAASFSLLVATVLLRSAIAAPQHVPPTMVGKPQLLGHTFDPSFVTGNASIPDDPGFYSDGGAGGFVNGYHLLTLSDARVRTRGGQVHTAYAFTSVNDPTNITILGDYQANPHFYLQRPGTSGQGVIASQPGDSCSGSTFGPAPNSAMVPIGSGNVTGGINVWNIYCGSLQYNTLIEYNVADLEGLQARSQNIPAQRTVLKLFQANQPLYGTDGIATDSTYIYFVARNDKYFKIARVLKSERTDTSKYTYYYPGSKAWTATVPSPNDNSTSTNFFIAKPSKVQFGTDLFYSPYFQTWLLSYSSNSGSGVYNLAYSTSGLVEGPYSDLAGFYGPPLDEGCDPKSPNYNPATDGSFRVTYLLHSHPGYDQSGKTLVIGWISCNTFTNFAKITFQ